MVITFFNYRGVVYNHQCRLAPKKGVHSKYYISMLKQLMKDHIPQKQPDLVLMWKLQAPSRQRSTSRFATSDQISRAQEDPGCTPHRFSPDLVSNDLPVAHGQKRPQGEAFSIHRCCCKSFTGDFKATVETRLRTCIPGLATLLERVHCLELRLFWAWPQCRCPIFRIIIFMARVWVFIEQPSYILSAVHNRSKTKTFYHFYSNNGHNIICNQPAVSLLDNENSNLSLHLQILKR